MKHHLAVLALALGIGAAQAQTPSTATPPTSAPPLQVREIGSLHVGGRVRALDGMPVREMVPSPARRPSGSIPMGSSWSRGCTRSM
ncbi:hypothetical protein [Teichococcus aestuarii]|uniref:hypothetical protein n=1 Tax=Teichococcus aestuarii TaxID=568898 RepID=UPI00361411DF